MPNTEPYRALVGWCQQCETYFEPYEPGGCFFIDCETPGGRQSRYVKRWMWIDPEHPEQFAYFSLSDLMEARETGE